MVVVHQVLVLLVVLLVVLVGHLAPLLRELLDKVMLAVVD